VRLNGIHHITAITGDAVANVEFYTGLLGLRMVKQTVNQDDPTVYHLFYGDEDGSPGMDLTFFEYPGAPPGSAGAGMVHRILWRVASPAALEFWRARLADAGMHSAGDESVLFADGEGLEHELLVAGEGEQPLVARNPEIPPEYALQGFQGVRAYAARPEASSALLGDTLGFSGGPQEWQVRGPSRHSQVLFDPAPEGSRPRPGGGTVHHVAFAAEPAEIGDWRARVAASGAHPTQVIDRFYFRSVYFREPNGVLFELATRGPGFAVDEDAASLGERLSLPPDFEALRERLKGVLRPLPYPPAWRRDE